MIFVFVIDLFDNINVKKVNTKVLILFILLSFRMPLGCVLDKK